MKTIYKIDILKRIKTKWNEIQTFRSRRSGRGQEAVESLVSEGLKPMFHQLDINDLSSITTAAAYFKDKYGGVDVLVNNAGIAFKGRTSTIHWYTVYYTTPEPYTQEC